jgi:hypothetical protein
MKTIEAWVVRILEHLDIRSSRILASACSILLIVVTCIPQHAQIVEDQSKPAAVQAILSNPIRMRQLFYVFMNYQHHLDTVADRQEQAGKDASGLRRTLQAHLKFSDKDYEPLRDSSGRVAIGVQSLAEEVKSSHRAITGFASARDNLLDSEMLLVDHQLSSENLAAFQRFLVMTFSPKQDLQKAVQ